MHVYVQQLTGGETVEIEIEPTYTISYVKVQIQYKIGTPADRIHLTFKDNKLEDDNKVTDYNIENGNTIYFEQTLYRGEGPSFGTTFVDLNDGDGLKRTEWAISAPRWRQAGRGLCLEGVCNNTNCKAHFQKVILNIGYKKFDMLQDANESTCNCPICDEYVEPLTCAFNNCWWRWSGVRQESKGKAPKSCSGDWKYADNAYHYFDEKTSGTVTWKSLILEVVEKKPF